MPPCNPSATYRIAFPACLQNEAMAQGEGGSLGAQQLAIRSQDTRFCPPGRILAEHSTRKSQLLFYQTTGLFPCRWVMGSEFPTSLPFGDQPLKLMPVGRRLWPGSQRPHSWCRRFPSSRCSLWGQYATSVSASSIFSRTQQETKKSYLEFSLSSPVL